MYSNIRIIRDLSNVATPVPVQCVKLTGVPILRIRRDLVMTFASLRQDVFVHNLQNNPK